MFNGIKTHALHLAGEVAVAGVGESLHFHHHRLVGAHKADIAVGQQRLNFHLLFVRHHHHNRLCRRYHPAHSVRG